MSDLGLRNITPDIEEWLAKIGVDTAAQLHKLGAKKTHLLLVEAGHAHDTELLYRLRGAVEDLDWKIVAERDKRRAKSRFVDVDEP